MKQNICIIGLSNKYVNSVAKSISNDFDMFFADIMAFIQFDLIDIDHAKNICGDDYIKKVEKNKVKTVSTFENTLFTLDYSLLNDDDNLKVVKDKAYVIYLKLNKNNITKMFNENKTPVNELNLVLDVYDYRDNLCTKYADYIVDCDGKNEAEIIDDVKNLF